MFGDISIEEFLRDYWQKKPLLIRQAFPNFISPITQDELAGLACEIDTARIVLEKGGKYPWEVRHGAFEEEDFAHLPSTHWTLLVNDTDQYLPELKAILDPFRFIPDWRIDDLMISFAVEGGSVGPHVDEYDVFLLQAQGQRRWQINTQIPQADNFLPDLELRIMRDFKAEQEWVVEPGDLLYLPPNVPHYGVALNECMTYSVGFRAPTQADMLERLLSDMLDEPRLKQRLTDTERPNQQSNPGELTLQDMDRLIDFIVDALPQDTQALQLWLGKYLTEPKNSTLLSESVTISRGELERSIRRKKTFIKSLESRALYFIDGDHLQFFMNGENITTYKNQQAFVKLLIASTRLEHSQYQAFIHDDEAFNFFHDLINLGYFESNK